GIKQDDIVLCPDGAGSYRVGEVIGNYYYVAGQVLRYMGFVKEQVAEDDQTVEGAIIALDEDPKMRWALISVPSISFYRYQISFNLVKG
ncbi:MAG: hypothetical protein O7A69_13900, partial [SAR324 cluster bacterium]|nr:hypothetical protein [SAR324 cluster bacterium]